MPHDAPPDRDAAFLAGLADSLLDVITAAPAGDNLLIHVKPAGDEYDIGFLRLEGRHPLDLLLGTDAPPEWSAVGAAVRGRPVPLEGGPDRRTLPASCESVVIVSRTGDVVGRTRIGERTFTEPPAYGLTLDCLQRTLDLPTAPPLVGTGGRFAVAWLDTLVHVASTSAAPVSWPEAAALHPANQLLDGDERPRAAAAIDLVPAALALERRCDWERLRWLVVEGGWHEPGLAPVDAAWLDAGSFSRLVLANTAPVASALAEVRRVAGASIARRCRAVVHRLGLRAGDEAGAGRGTAA